MAELRLDVFTNVSAVSDDYTRATERIIRQAEKLTRAQETAARSLTFAGGGSQAANAQIQQIERVSAAQTRATSARRTDVAALREQERAQQRQIQAGLTALSTLGGEARAFAQLTRFRLRESAAIGEQTDRSRVLASVQAQLRARTAEANSQFSVGAVVSRDLRLNMLGMNQALTLLSTSFGRFGPTAIGVFQGISRSINEARHQVSQFIAQSALVGKVGVGEGAGGGSIFGGGLGAGAAGGLAARPGLGTRALAAVGGPGVLIPAATIAATTVAFGKLVSVSNDIEVAFDEVSAITGITGAQLERLTEQSIALAGTSENLKNGTVDVAEAFKLVASAAPELIGAGDGLERVTSAAILLSKASGDDLKPSVETLTTALLQFRLDAEESTRVVDALAAGAKVGAIEIPQLGEAISRTGAIASAAGIPLEDLIATIETAGRSGQPLELISRSLRNIILNLQTSGRLSPGESIVQVLRDLEQEGLGVTEMQKLFGRQNITTAQSLLQNLDSLEEYAKGVREAGVATEQATLRLDNMPGALARAGAAWGAFTDALSETELVKGASDAIQGLLDDAARFISIGAARLAGTPEEDILARVFPSEEAIAREAGRVLLRIQQVRASIKEGFEPDDFPAIRALEERYDLLQRVIERQQLLKQPIQGPELPPDQSRLIEESIASTRALVLEVDNEAAAQARLGAVLDRIAEQRNIHIVTNGKAGLSEAEAARLTDLATASIDRNSAAHKSRTATLEAEASVTNRLNSAAGQLTKSLADLARTRAQQDAASAQRIADIERETEILKRQKDAVAEGPEAVAKLRAELRAEEEIGRINLQREAQRQALEAVREEFALKQQLLLEEFELKQRLLVAGKEIKSEEADSRIASARAAVQRAIESASSRINEQIASIKNLTKAEEDHIRAVILGNEKAKASLRLAEQDQERVRSSAEEPFRRAGENIQREFGNLFTDLFRNGRIEAESFGDFLKDLFARLAGELVTANLFGGLFGQQGGGQAGGGLLGGLFSLFGGGGSNVVPATGLPATATLDQVLASLRESTEEGTAKGAAKGSESGFLAAISQLGGSLFGSGSRGGGDGESGNGLGSIFGSLLGGVGLGFAASGIVGSLGFGGTAQLISGIGAGIGGIVGGALLGASLGSIIPGLGTIVGAIAGASAGPTIASTVAVTDAFLEGENPFIGASPSEARLAGFAYSIGAGTLGGAFAPVGGFALGSFLGEQAGIGSTAGGIIGAIGLGPLLTIPGVAAVIFDQLQGRPSRSRFSFDTTAGGPGSETPFGFVTGTLGGRGALQDIDPLVDTIVRLDKALADLIDPSTIAAAAQAVQNQPNFQFVARKPGDIEAAFADFLEDRVIRVIEAAEGPDLGRVFDDRFLPGNPGSVQQVLDAITSFFRELGTFEGNIRTLSGEEIPQLEVSIGQLGQHLGQAREQANEFGFDVAKLDEAFEKGKLKLSTDFLDSANRQLLAFDNPLAAALIEQQIQAEARLGNARIAEANGAAGAILAIEALNARERLELIEQFTQQANSSLLSLQDQLTIGELGGLSSPQRLAEARARFEQERAEAFANPSDPSERADVAEAGRVFAELLREVGASGPLFQEGRLEILAALEQLIAIPLTGALDGGLPDNVANADLQATQINATQATTDAVVDMQDQIAQLVVLVAEQNVKLDEQAQTIARLIAGTI